MDMSMVEAPAKAPAPITRGKGRPCLLSSQEHVLTALMDAAQECLETLPKSRITGRQIAQLAGVTQPMINYYFQSKDGLLAALFERDYQDLIRKVRKFQKTGADAADGTGSSIEHLMEMMETHFRERSALVVLVHNEAMKDGTSVWGLYVSRLASRCYTAVTETIAAMIRDGRCRADVLPGHAAYMICSLCTIPTFMRPIFEVAFNCSPDGDEYRERRRTVARMLEPMPMAS